MKELDKGRARDLLNNWRRYSRDNPPDPAEVNYYTVSPMFKDFVKPNPGPSPYDPESAEMVEDVLRFMFQQYPFERDMLVTYYLRSGTVEDVAKILGHGKRRMYELLELSHKAFAKAWYEL